MFVRPYREVLATPGALAFSTAGFVARLPISTYGLGIVLLVSATTGRYGLAGAVTAAYGLAVSVAGPLLSRAADRIGQGRVLLPAATLNSAGVVLLVLAARADAPPIVLIGCAVLVGAASVSVGSLVRARWRYVLGTSDRMHTAFALESVVDELIFVIGPVAVTLLATGVDPAAGPLAVAATALAGSLWLVAQRSTAPPTDRTAHTAGGSALRIATVRVIGLVFLAVGGIFGSAEVITVAFTDERGQRAAAGIVLGALALGSMLSGLAYGAMTFRGPPPARFVAGVVLLGVGTLPFALVTTVPALTVVMFVAGLAISPMVVSGFGVIDATVPTARLTEGLTWVTTAINLGAAGGAAAAGAAVDAAGGHRAFMVTVAFAAAAVVLTFAGRRALLRTPSAPAPAAPAAAPAQLPE